MPPADPLSARIVPSSKHRKGNVYLTTVCLSSVVFAAVFFSLPTLVSIGFPGCKRPDCFDVIGEMAASINPSVDPCDNFYNFVCSRWRNYYPEDAHNLALLRRRIQRSLFETLTNHKASPSMDAVDIASAAFQSCTHTALKDDGFGTEILRQFLDRIGIPWPSPPRSFKTSLLEFLVMLSLEWNIPVFFDLGIVPNFKTNRGAILHLAGSTVLEEWIINRYSLGGVHGVGVYIKGLAQALGDPRVDYRPMAEKLALVDMDVLATAFQSKVSGTGYPAYVKYSRLHNLTGPVVPSYEWIRAINKHLPEAHPVTPEDSIFVSNGRLFSRVESLLSKYVAPERTSVLLMYVAFHVARQLAPYASFHLASLSNVRGPTFQKKAKQYEEFLNRCYSSVLEHLGHAVAWLFIEKWVSEDTRRKVAGLVDSIRNVSQHSFKDVDWMDEQTRKGATDKISTLREIIGHPEHLVDRAAVNQFYHYIPSPREPYLAMLLELKRARMNNLKESFADEAQLRREDISISLVAANAYYVSVYHVVVIPAGLMFSPFYVRGGRDALNYGGLGHIVGHEITHMFDPQHGMLDQTGLFVDWYSNYSRARFKEKLECLKEIYNTATGNNETQVGQSALSENFADTVGLRKAYQAFQLAKGKPWEPATFSLPSGAVALFNNEQLFFLSSCYKWCGWEVYGDYNYAPLTLRCNVPLMNMPEFSEAFRCAPGSAMNPRKKCAALL
ncbi:endothelin-converting enzyme 1-like [Ornithodoros turicata]|uniref:endothelin-converting enzyme 1-like n=1 Tax=Ornithodoros turicata TaxID=34597 RepID=UPI0031388624